MRTAVSSPPPGPWEPVRCLGPVYYLDPALLPALKVKEHHQQPVVTEASALQCFYFGDFIPLFYFNLSHLIFLAKI